VAIVLMAAPCLATVKLPERVIPEGFGVNIHFRGEPQDLDLIAEAGFRFIRMDLSWGGIEREKGVYRFDKMGYDALTEGCSERDIRILYILDYSNRLYESDRSVQTPEGQKAFAAFAEAAASRYAGKAILWEIWNEPNLKHFWSPQPSVSDYCKLVEQTAPRIRKADPTGLVVAPATSGIPLDWLQACFEKGLLEHIDVLSVHPYRSKPPETVVPDYAALRELIGRYAPDGKRIPIISGEWGYSNVNWDKTRLSDAQQGQYLVRMFLTNLSQNVPVSIWYDWCNDGTNPNEREHNFGTVTHDLKPKEAYRAAKTLNTTLKGYRFEQQVPLDNEQDVALLFVKGDKKALVVWTVQGKHQTALPFDPRKARIVDMLGRELIISWKTEPPAVQISQRPKYLLLKPE
jgi:hypothetical protein